MRRSTSLLTTNNERAPRTTTNRDSDQSRFVSPPSSSDYGSSLSSPSTVMISQHFDVLVPPALALGTNGSMTRDPNSLENNTTTTITSNVYSEVAYPNATSEPFGNDAEAYLSESPPPPQHRASFAKRVRSWCSWSAWRARITDHGNIQLGMTFVGVVVGLVVGVLVNKFSTPSATTLKLLHVPGELLLRMLNCLIVPLVISSMISSMTAMGDVRKAGKIGAYALLYYLTTTVLAVIIGLTMVNVMQPGRKGGGDYPINPVPHREDGRCPKTSTDPLDNILNVLKDMFPSNLVDAASNEALCHLNVLGIIVVSLAFGGVLSTMGEDGEPVRKFFESFNKVIMKLVFLVIWYAPIGICFLIIWRFASEPDLIKMIKQLGFYILTVLVGLLVHSIVTIPIVYLLLVRKNPLKHLAGMASALLTALGTSSSSATMPLTLRCCEQNLGMNPQVTNFVIPLGATVNMDGTACYEAVAAIFIAQALNIKLSFAHMIMVALTATLASIGAAGIPEAGLVTLVLVCQSVGLPVEGIGLILAVDWFLDRFRTVVNVWGDSVGAAVVNKLVAHKLAHQTLLTTVEDEADSVSYYHEKDSGNA